MADTMTAAENFIAGEWRPSAAGDTYEKRNPARPDEVVGEFPSSTREDVDLAVAGRRGRPQRHGPARPVAKRAAVLNAAAALIDERAEAIAQDMTREMGKPLREARMEAARAAADPALLGRRGVPPGRRALRAGGHRRPGLHRAPPRRRRRADHALELPGRDPGLEARARARSTATRSCSSSRRTHR